MESLILLFSVPVTKTHCASGTPCNRPSLHRLSWLSSVIKEMFTSLQSCRSLLRASHEALRLKFIKTELCSCLNHLHYFPKIQFGINSLGNQNSAVPAFNNCYLSDRCLPIRTLLYVSCKHILISLTSFMGTRNSMRILYSTSPSLNRQGLIIQYVVYGMND
jgi:hypothetical protein